MDYSVEKLLDLPFYTEGPAMDDAGNFYFSTLTGGFVGKIDQRGQYSEWAKGTCPNGQLILKDGTHLFCDSRGACINQYSESGLFYASLIQNTCAGIPFSSPNDLIMDSNQNLYFTESVRQNGKVFFRSAAGQERVVATGIDYANGLAFSPDERYLYVAESYQNRILIIELARPGIGKDQPEVFADLPVHQSGNPICNLPDGLATDRNGRIWVAHYGMQAIQVLALTGELLFTIDTKLPLTSNLCFVADDSSAQKLLVTGGYGEPGSGAVLLITVHA